MWKNIFNKIFKKMVNLVAGGSAEDEDEAVWSLVEVEEPDDQSEMVTVVT